MPGVVLWLWWWMTPSDGLIFAELQGKLLESRPSDPEPRRWKQLGLCAVSANWLDTGDGVRATWPKTEHAPEPIPSFSLRPLSAPGRLLSSLPHPFQMAVVWDDFRKKVGLRGGACTLPLYPHLISPLSLLVFSLPSSVSLSLPLPRPASRHTTRTPMHACARTHTRVSTHSLEPSLLSVANTLAHRHKHTLRQSKSKNRGGRERRERESDGGREREPKWAERGTWCWYHEKA